MILSFKILGKPVPKQSFRFTKQGRRYQNKEVKDMEQNIMMDIKSQLPADFVPFDEPLSMHVRYIFPIPSSLRAAQKKAIEAGEKVYKQTRPDVTDNLTKGVADAMDGIVFVDDARVVRIYAEKYYGKVPRTEILIQTLK